VDIPPLEHAPLLGRQQVEDVELGSRQVETSRPHIRIEQIAANLQLSSYERLANAP
jgi:hypothetical protein